MTQSEDESAGKKILIIEDEDDIEAMRQQVIVSLVESRIAVTDWASYGPMAHIYDEATRQKIWENCHHNVWWSTHLLTHYFGMTEESIAPPATAKPYLVGYPADEV